MSLNPIANAPTAPTRRGLRRMCIWSLGIVAVPAAVSAQVGVSVQFEEGIVPNVEFISPAWRQPGDPCVPGDVCTRICVSAGVPFTFGLVSAQANFPSDGGSVNLTLEWANNPVAIGEAIVGNFDSIPVPPIGVCGVTQDYGVLSGRVELRTFLQGNLFTPFLTFTRRGTASVSFSDSLVIESAGAAEIECPVSFAGGVQAAETFGLEPTHARAVLSLVGSFAGETFAFNETIESADFVPSEGGLNVERTVRLSLQPGMNVFPVSLSGSVQAEATVSIQSIIGGSAIVIVDFPNSVHFGRFRGVGGAPLPLGVTIRSLNTPDLVYESDDACPADFNRDGFVNSQDFFDFITVFFALDPAGDFNADGFINSQDYFDFLAAFFAGC